MHEQKSKSRGSAAFNSRRLVKRLILPSHETLVPTQKLIVKGKML
jgi:hypothetical protein